MKRKRKHAEAVKRHRVSVEWEVGNVPGPRDPQGEIEEMQRDKNKTAWYSLVPKKKILEKLKGLLHFE